MEVVPPPAQLTCCRQSPVQVWAGDSAQSNTVAQSNANKQRIADLPGDTQIRTRSEANIVAPIVARWPRLKNNFATWYPLSGCPLRTRVGPHTTPRQARYTKPAREMVPPVKRSL